ncbi:MAG: hypothetical protein ACJ8C4_10630 [Gemmataceae bacterium]
MRPKICIAMIIFSIVIASVITICLLWALPQTVETQSTRENDSLTSTVLPACDTISFFSFSGSGDRLLVGRVAATPELLVIDPTKGSMRTYRLDHPIIFADSMNGQLIAVSDTLDLLSYDAAHEAWITNTRHSERRNVSDFVLNKSTHVGIILFRNATYDVATIDIEKGEIHNFSLDAERKVATALNEWCYIMSYSGRVWRTKTFGQCDEMRPAGEIGKPKLHLCVGLEKGKQVVVLDPHHAMNVFATVPDVTLSKSIDVHRDSIRCMCPGLEDDSIVIAGGGGNTDPGFVAVLKDGKELGRIVTPFGPVNYLAISPSQRKLAMMNVPTKVFWLDWSQVAK